MTRITMAQISESFHEIPSKVEGISVFAPKPKASPELTPRSYKCPQCGATTRFDVMHGGVSCEHCGYLAPLINKVVGQDAEQHEFTLEALELSEQGWGIDRINLHCDSCGSDLSLPPESLTSTCPFCASNKVNIGRASADILRPKYIIPFKINQEYIQSHTREWLGKGWFHPPELASNAMIHKFKGIYLPFWTFDAQLDAKWQAQVGYERTVRDREGNTRTVIDWRWENGKVSLHYDDLPQTGTNKVSSFILEKLLPFQMQDLTPYSPDYLAGWQAQNYNIALTDAWLTAKDKMRSQAQTTCRSQIHSSHIRNFSVTIDFSDEAWRYILLPVYLAAYKHENRVFQVMVNGQTGTVAGQKPVAWWKIWVAIVAMLLPGLVLGLIGLPLLLFAGIGIAPLILGIFLLIPGGIFSFLLYQKAIDSERS